MNVSDLIRALSSLSPTLEVDVNVIGISPEGVVTFHGNHDKTSAPVMTAGQAEEFLFEMIHDGSPEEAHKVSTMVQEYALKGYFEERLPALTDWVAANVDPDEEVGSALLAVLSDEEVFEIYKKVTK